ncbi:MAG: hypothetical protein ABW133_06090 [Polyangiaceae bacterium]
MTTSHAISSNEGGRREKSARSEGERAFLLDPLVRAFEAGTIDPSGFRHREHLYVAWCYLKALPVEEALLRYVRNLRALTEKLGVPGKFHATMTWGYVVLLDGAMRDPELAQTDFDALVSRYPALLDAKRGALFDYYDAEELAAAVARERFVLPRRK